MSDSQAYEEVTIGAEGVTLTKRFEEDEFPVPAIAFVFSSERDVDVRVRMVDQVPEGVAVEDLGFHPEYGSEFWTIDDDRIVFEREIEAGSEYTTVYGIRATGTDDVEQFLTTPELAAVDPPVDGDPGDVIPENDEVVKDVISGDADGVPGLDNDEEIEELDLEEPDAASEGESDSPGAEEPAESTNGAGDTGSAADAESGGATLGLEGDSLVAALATEIRQNDVDAEDVKLLRQAFEIAGQEGGTVHARIEGLQSDVADLRAYSDALEEFLDENGTGEQLIEDFRTDLEALEAEMESIGTEVSTVESALETTDDEVETVADEVESMGEDLADLQSDLGDLESLVSDLEEDANEADEEVLDRLEAMEEDLAELQTWQEQITETFGG